MIEYGRYCWPTIPDDLRLCQHCSLNEIEDEKRFIFNCPLYLNERRSISYKYPNYPVVRTGSSNTPFFFHYNYPTVRTGSSNTHFFFRVFFYPAVRTGSSNTHFFPCFFFGRHLPQTSAFRSAKQILVVSFATQARAFILSDRNIFYTLPGGGGEEQRRGLMPLGLFLFFWCSLAPDLRFSLGQRNTRRVFRYTAKGFYLE